MTASWPKPARSVFTATEPYTSTLPYEPAPTATGSPVRSKVAYCRSSGTARSPSGRGIR
ncbi:hypothetical protein [Suid alphaherpesvirus 1]|nr:hypothetical protein [Suid alphaherpesvirus 1]